jgi:predicted N-acetyltransferase YhbS
VPIRRAGPGDIEPALAVLADAFGVQARVPSVYTLVADAPDGTLLVAEEDGEVVGTAASIGFGRTGWLGGITVAPAARGRGLGRELTSAALDALGPRETVLLLATDVGRPIYERLGFVAEGRYAVFKAEVAGAGGEFEVARDVRVVDRRATGEDRSVVLEACTAVGYGGAVALRPPWRALPIVGSADGAEVLLRGLVEPGMRLAVPEENARAVRVISGLGTEGPSVVRMRLGRVVEWQPGEVWGVFSLFFG